MSKPAWSARCDCYNGHNSSSGRCTCRSTVIDGVTKPGVMDATRHEGQQAICEDCRTNCLAGKGDRTQKFFEDAK